MDGVYDASAVLKAYMGVEQITTYLSTIIQFRYG